MICLLSSPVLLFWQDILSFQFCSESTGYNIKILNSSLVIKSFAIGVLFTA